MCHMDMHNKLYLISQRKICIRQISQSIRNSTGMIQEIVILFVPLTNPLMKIQYQLKKGEKLTHKEGSGLTASNQKGRNVGPSHNSSGSAGTRPQCLPADFAT